MAKKNIRRQPQFLQAAPQFPQPRIGPFAEYIVDLLSPRRVGQHRPQGGHRQLAELKGPDPFRPAQVLVADSIACPDAGK